MSIIVEDELSADTLHHGGSQERELFVPGFDEGGKPSKASSDKVNLACRFVGGYACRFCRKS
jgi:hypothetical protein